MGQLRWGIVGTGGIAHSFVRDLQAAGIDVVAVGSRHEDTARAFAAEFGLDPEHAHVGADALATDDAVDAVYVATPHTAHADDALAAIRAGKPVLVEKAFTVNQAEAREVVDAAADAGIAVMEAMWTRFLPQSAMIREVIAEGRIGRPRFVTATHHQLLPTDPHHRLNDPAQGGGAILDLGIYPISFAVDVLGVPDDVHAIGALSDLGVDTRMGLLLGHPGGATSTLTFALDVKSSNTATIIGEDGRIDIDDNWFSPTTWRIRDRTGVVVEEFDAREELTGLHHEARAFAAFVTDGGDVASGPMPPEQSVAIMGVMDEARRQVGVRYPSER